MKIDFVSDVSCPWCAIGLTALETALAELEEALDAVLLAFRIGRNSLLSRFFAPRADRILHVAVPGSANPDFARLRLPKAARPLWPIVADPF